MSLSQQHLAELVASILPALMSTIQQQPQSHEPHQQQSHEPQSHQQQSHQPQPHQPQPHQETTATSLVDSNVVSQSYSLYF